MVLVLVVLHTPLYMVLMIPLLVDGGVYIVIPLVVIPLVVCIHGAIDGGVYIVVSG